MEYTTNFLMLRRQIPHWLVERPFLHVLVGGCVRALVIGIVFYFIVYLLERASGGATTQYRSRGFVHDVVYWFYYSSGLNQLLFMTAVFSFFSTKLAFLQVGAIKALPPIARGILWFVTGGFIDYWVHRLQHRSRFLWAFHSTHHSQEQLNLLTTTRFHPVDHCIANSLRFIPLFVLGASPLTWLPFYLVMDFIAITQHSRITWRFGMLSKILATPRFHSFHHSADPRHYNKNFGGLFSIWDHVFGTAVDDPQQPAEYGLSDIKMPTLMSTLIQPFRLLPKLYARDRSSPKGSVDAISGSTTAGEPRIG